MNAMPVLNPDERIVWQGELQNLTCSVFLTLLVVCGSLATGAISVSAINMIGLRVAVASIVLLTATIAVQGLRDIPGRYVRTDRRMAELDRKGSTLWRYGSCLARTQNADSRATLYRSTLVVETVQLDHCDPTKVRMGSISKVQAKGRIQSLKTLKVFPVGLSG